MLTRRQVLAGTAAGSIAVIASARGVAAAASSAGGGFDAGFGNLEGGAAVAFHKEEIGFSFFVKLHDSAAQVFYKEETLGVINVFLKYFDKVDLNEAAFQKKSWQMVGSLDGYLKDVPDAGAGFLKLDSSLAQIFLKFENSDRRLTEDVRTLQGGMLVGGTDACQAGEIIE
jgi:hypothetical protein